MKLGHGKNIKPHALRKSGGKARRREEKRVEAEARQEKYNSLTPQQKLELVKSRPGSSAREVSRLEKIMKQ